MNTDDCQSLVIISYYCALSKLITCYKKIFFQGTKRAEISNLIDTYVCGTIGQVNDSELCTGSQVK